MLTDLCTPSSLAEAFARGGRFPFPAEELPDTPAARRRIAGAVARARAELPTPWPAFKTSDFLRFRRDGDRSAFERPYFERRHRLGAAALAWAATREAAFADAVADGAWLICEESTWCVPAHFGGSADTSFLPTPVWPGSIDLFNCETAQCLAEACQLAGSAIDAVDPAINRRVRAEIRRRVIDPVVADGLPHWGSGQSNWGPWCASSLIAAAGWVFAEDPRAWGSFVHLLLGTVSRYVDKQGADGGCDEGVTYWNVAGGAVLRAIEDIRARAPGALEPWRDTKLGEIMRFPARMHLGGGLFPAFGDTVPKARVWSGVLARAGALVGAAELGGLAQELSQPEDDTALGLRATGDYLQCNLRALWWQEAMPPAAPGTLGDAWLPQLQVLVAHGGGLSLAVKGGNNAENHNHNDVGQPVVHYRGRPVLVDAGRGEYTAQTFGPRRYDLWWTAGAGHALPILDEVAEATGWEHQARDVAAELLPERASVRMDLAACYPRSGLTVERRIVLDRRTPQVELHDRVGGCARYRLPLRFACEPVADGADWLVGGLRLSAPGLRASCVRMDLAAEPTVRLSWPEGLWLLTLEREVAGTIEVAVVLRPA